MNRREEIRIRRELKGEMRDLHITSGYVSALVYLCAQCFYAIIAASFSHSIWLQLGPDLPGIALTVYFPSAFFIATRLRAISLLKHEASHGLIDKRPQVNKWIGELASVFDHQSFVDYKAAHIKHHRHFGTEALDPDFNYKAQRLMNSLLEAFRPTVFTNYIKLGSSCNGDSALAILGRLIFNLGLPLISFMTGNFDLYVAYVFIPYLILYPIVQAMGDYLDHSEKWPSFLFFDENIVANLMRLLLLPRNDRFHMAHHIFPRIPGGYLPECHRRLMTHPIYASHVHKLRRENQT